jgi:hypothetical protein
MVVMLPDRIFRFVQWDRLADYERIGWLTVADLGDYHGAAWCAVPMALRLRLY